MKALLLGVSAAVLAVVSAQAQTLQFSTTYNEQNAFAKEIAIWAADVKEATGIDFKISFNGALVSLPATLDAVGDGVVPSALGLASLMSGAIPAVGYPEMMGGMPRQDPEAGQALTEIWPHLNKAMERHRVRALWGSPGYHAGVVCRDGFLKGAQDWAGKTIRASGRWQVKQVEAMGATAVTTPPAEIFVGLQNGVIDCSLLVPAIVFATRMYEVAPYWTDLDVGANFTVALIGLDVWNKLTDEQRSKISEISDQRTLGGASTLREAAEKDLENLEKVAKVYRATEAERAEFLERSKPIFEAMAASVTDGPGKAIVEVMQKYQQQ